VLRYYYRLFRCWDHRLIRDWDDLAGALAGRGHGRGAVCNTPEVDAAPSTAVSAQHVNLRGDVGPDSMQIRHLATVLCAGALLVAGCAGGPDDTTPPVDGQPVTTTVIDVVDGDTVDIRYSNGTTDTVRLLGVDTPEVNTDVSPDEFEGVADTAAGRACLRDWGKRASEYARQELAGEAVEVRFDDGAARRGTHDRLLMYVVVDGQNFNYGLVAKGYARVFDGSFTQSERFYDAEADAQAAQTGVWACRSITTPALSTPSGYANLTGTGI